MVLNNDLKICFEELRKYLEIEVPKFPKYASSLINLANQYAQGTRPRVVGQMRKLNQQFTGKTLSEWEEWYLKQKPDAIKKRQKRYFRCFIKLKFQEAILKKGAEIKGTDYRLTEPDEESQGIDGYIGKIPISIKPYTYEVKASLPKHIEVKIIYYRKMDDSIEVDYGEIL